LRTAKFDAGEQSAGSEAELLVPTRKHTEPVQPDSNDQSGSTGRRTDKKHLGKDKDAGQDRYGQSGMGGKQNRETIGQQSYRKSASGKEQVPNPDSNAGSGRAEDESEQRQKTPAIKP
jgi:hypothetical protein